MGSAPSILAEVLAGAVPGDFGERERVYLVPVPGDAFMRLSARAATALRLHAEGLSLDEAADATAEGATAWDGARVKQIRDRLIARATSQSTVPDSIGFFLRRQLLSASVVRRIAGALTILYRPPVAILAVVVAVIVLTASIGQPAHDSVSDVLCGYALMVASLFAHELGHASAVAAFGGRPGPIGFTFYVIYPALYSDVTAAWRLSRKQRFAVDIGGVYFQVIFISVISLMSTLWALPGVHFGILLTALSIVMTMNPFLKFDGYWMLADALGIANLAKWRQTSIRNAWAWLRNRPRAPVPWKPITSAIVAIYSVSSGLFAAAFTIYLLPRLWHALVAYPSYIRAAILDLEHTSSPAPWFAVAGSTIVLLFGVRVLVATIVQCRSIVRRLRRD